MAAQVEPEKKTSSVSLQRVARSKNRLSMELWSASALPARGRRHPGQREANSLPYNGIAIITVSVPVNGERLVADRDSGRVPPDRLQRERKVLRCRNGRSDGE